MVERGRTSRGRQKKGGFSLLEMLVSVAIIGILMAMYSTVLSTAMRKAKGVASGAALAQTNIGRAADGQGAEDPVEAYRQELDTGKGQTIMSELVFVVRTDDEFQAYWHTLLNENNPSSPQINGAGALLAQSPTGEIFTLPRIGTSSPGKGGYAVAWEFISTDLSETAMGTLGANIVYSDGHIDFVKYPGKFPMTPTVARLSHRFMEQQNL